MNLNDFHKIQDERERLKFLVHLAMAAPSSHNTQPWKFRLGDKIIDLWGDEKRTLPASDSNHRQFFVSLGCALENILVALDYYGLPHKLTLFPDGREKFWAARIKLEHLRPVASGRAHLASAIAHRHTNREEYDAVGIPKDFGDRIKKLAGSDLRIDLVEDNVRREKIINAVLNATRAAFNDKEFCWELSHWLKPSLKKYRDGMPGYNIGVPWLISFLMPHALRRVNLSKPQTKMIEKQVRATPAFLLISTRKDEPAAWLQAGRVLERIWLMATQDGLKLGPLAAAIQIGEFHKDIQKVLDTDFRPQVFSRIGYAAKIPRPSPRLELEDALIQ